MAQHDYVIANGTGAAVRSDLNNALAAIVSQNSGATAPSTTYAYQWWADTTTGLLKLRNAANNAWITLFQLDGEWSTLAVENGSAAAPSIYFKDSGTDTGIYSPGTDQVAISTGGTGRLFVDSSGRVGLGTASPSESLQVGPSTGTTGYSFFVTTPAVNAGSGSGFKVSGTYASTLSLINVDAIGVSSGGYGSALAFRTTLETSGPVERMRIDSSGRLGIGTTPNEKLHVSGGNVYVQNSAGNPCFIDLAANGGASVGSSLTISQESAGVAAIFNRANAAMYFATNGTERGRFDSSGRFLVGTSSSILSYANLQVTGGSDNAGHVCLANGGTAPVNGANIGSIRFTNSAGGIGAQFNCEADGAWTAGSNYRSRLVFSTTADGASSPTERMRIKSSGTIQLGAGTLGLTGTLVVDPTGVGMGYAMTINNPASGSTNEVVIDIYRQGVRTGYITNTNTATSYTSTSDYRLKENIVAISDGIARLRQLKPSRFNFKIEPDNVVDGFLAHEVQGIVPEAITGAKDAVDDDGNPIYQGIDQSKLVPLLTAALQEALQKIDAMEARLAALEGV